LDHDVDAPPSTGHRAASDLVAVLRERAPRLALALAAGQAAWPAVTWARNQADERRRYTVKVLGTDDMWDDVHEWVLGLLPDEDRRALVAWSSKQAYHPEPQRLSGRQRPGKPPAALRLRYDGSREQVIRVGPHKIKVVVADGIRPGAEQGRPPEIVFTAATAAARDALLAEVGGVLDRSQQANRKPLFRMLDRWGDWTRLDDRPARTLDSVILPAGQAERLTADISRFLAAEADYERRGLPWHRGHLYSGPPGTGKTSIARALAAHFSMDVWLLSLRDVTKDAELLGLASRIGPRSMLLIEDVDVFRAATERDDEGPGVSLSGLLNTLDGIATPHGLLFILTSNNPGALDSAVIRDGRVDLHEHFGPADPAQVARLVARYYGVPLPVTTVTPGREMVPAQVYEVCKRHDKPLAAISDLTGAATAVPA
jgi:hypothetical protein